MPAMAKNAAQDTSTTNSTPTHDEIAAQAYQIYLREGCVEGRDMDHWLQAESELRMRVISQDTDRAETKPSNERFARTEADQAPRSQRNNKPDSILPNNLVPQASPITQISRGTTPKRNSGKREAANTR